MQKNRHFEIKTSLIYRGSLLKKDFKILHQKSVQCNALFVSNVCLLDLNVPRKVGKYAGMVDGNRYFYPPNWRNV